jgi:hypothetical protein
MPAEDVHDSDHIDELEMPDSNPQADRALSMDTEAVDEDMAFCELIRTALAEVHDFRLPATATALS